MSVIPSLKKIPHDDYPARLNFGAFDIIRDEDDTLYFIKLNPNGQWYWIEIITKMPMVRAIVELIEDLALQYQQDC